MRQTLSKLKTYVLWIHKASSKIKIQLTIGTIFGILKVICGLIFILQSKQMIDIATGTAKGELWHGACVLSAIIIIELILGVSNGYLYNQAENMMKNGLRERLFAHLLISPLYKRGTFHSGDLTARLEEDVRIVTSNITTSLPTVVITVTQFVGAFWLLLEFDPHLAWIIVFILPVFMIIGKIISVKLRKMTKEIREEQSKIQSHLQEGLLHSSLLRSLEAETYVRKNFSSLQYDVFCKIMKRTRFSLGSRAMFSLGLSIGYLVAFIWGCYRIEIGAISFGVMTAFLQLVAKIQGPTASLAQLLPGFIHASTSIDRLMEIEEFETEEAGNKKLFKQTPGIKFENLRYSYPDVDRPLYESFNYDFAPGSRTAILGPTGTGKTTLIRLILALIKPDAGKVSIYNAEESEVVSPGTRCNISYVPQGNTLLSGTIKENLTIVNPKATDEDIRRALHIAVADFVYDLPDGLNTLCGERGKGLSEGQAQRIAIARGLLKPASILLLDEISASLDKDTEALLFKRLAEEASEKTLIMITHRTNIAVYCDHVLQL